MRYHQISVLSVLVTLTLGGLTIHSPWDDIHTKHSWNAVPPKWESLGCPPDGTIFDLYVALRAHRENPLIDVLNEVSDPMHRKYGAHLSKEQVAELVAPRPDTLELVYSWLGHHSVLPSSVSVTHGGSSLKLAGIPVSQANDLLGASYQLYNHVETNVTILRTISYSLPVVLHGHVQIVAPTTHFASTRTRRQEVRKHSGGVATGLDSEKVVSGEPVMALSSRSENYLATPSFLRWRYGTWGYTPSATDRNLLGIVGFVGHYPSPADLGEFMSRYWRYGTGATFTVVEANGGGYDPSNPHPEANLDTQYAEAMSCPTPQVFYSTGIGPLGTDDSYLSWFDYILSQQRIPQTISISYANPEKDYDDDYKIYLCDFLFAQLGLRGVSVLISTGDDGVGKGNCEANDKSGNVQFVPYFPASCPWVTSVGGTTDYPEVAASLSGGGFSRFFERPNYQEQAVSIFLQKLGNKYPGLYNPFGRGIPDISAQALKFPIVFNGYELLMFGTSCSTPVVAGIISLLNDYLLSEGKAPLGFLNPWLYGGALSSINDIVSGSNPGCNTDGFPAIAGWDPVTGLGTLNFERLQQTLPVVPKQTS